MGVRAISFAGAKGNRFSCCLGCGGVDFREDNAIALDNLVNLKNSSQVSLVPFCDVSQLTQEE